MIAPVTIVYSLISDCKELKSPASFTVFRVMSIAHSVMWLYRKQTVYRKRENWFYLAAGNIAAYAIGERKIKFWLKIATLLFRVQRIIDRVLKVQSSIQDLKNALRGRHPIQNFTKWDTSENAPNHANQITQALRHTFSCIGHLSFECWAAYDTFYMEELDETLCDGKKSLEYLVAHKEDILKTIQSQGPLMKKIFMQLHLPLGPEQIVHGAEQVLNAVNSINTKLDNFSSAVTSRLF